MKRFTTRQGYEHGLTRMGVAPVTSNLRSYWKAKAQGRKNVRGLSTKPTIKQIYSLFCRIDFSRFSHFLLGRTFHHKVFEMTVILSLLLFSFSLFADSSTTTLTDLKQIEIFNDVTSRIRCICLPSLPIKSCSFNNCAISAQLKFFIENRIRKGETANEIVQKMQTGFGEEALSDPIIQKLQNSGNENMVSGVVNGFGERILAQPDSTWINLTLFAGMALGLGLIFYYLKGRLKKAKTESSPQTKQTLSADAEKYLKEISG